MTMEDVDVLVELDREPEVMRFLTGGRPTARDDVVEVVRRRLGQRWMGFERGAEGFVGWYGLVPTGDREFEVGYRLRREAWGRGLAVEGTHALLSAAFRDLDAQRVWAQTMAIHQRSRQVLERCGLRYVRTFHLEWDDPIEGTEFGEVEYELRRSDWADL
jgi:RimJ/RimL family protein N-acetyltransferase